MPFVIQGLNCLCGFNFTLIFGKHSLYKERKISRNLLYASLTFRKILILFQSILRNFCLNLSIDRSGILRLKMYCSVISASILFFVAKMIGKWSEICFHNNSLNFYIVRDSICKYVVRDSICKYVINCSVPCDTYRFVYRRNHSRSKHYINKALNSFIFIKIKKIRVEIASFLGKMFFICFLNSVVSSFGDR